MPVHFYGQLCKTAEGCNLIKKRGYVLELSQTIKSWTTLQTAEEVMTLKAALWAIVRDLKLII